MRMRSSAGAWRCLILNMLSHVLDTNIFPPSFIFSQFNDKAQYCASKQYQFLEHSAVSALFLA